MNSSLVMVHSPSVGPSTWLPVAGRVLAGGVDAVVPDLRHVGQVGPPYWPTVAETVADAMGQLDAPGPVVLVAHSNAGLFLPTVAEASPRPVVGAVFVDAALPAESGDTPVAEPEFLVRLRALAGADRWLPRWTDWWAEEDVAALLPEPTVRAVVVDDQPRLPLDYYEQSVPVPPSWAHVPCGYLQFSAAYDAQAGRARRSGWPFAHLPGEHLHQVVDPDRVTRVLLELVAEVTARAVRHPQA